MRNHTVAIIFSKDRALQLDGVIRFLRLHCKDLHSMDVKILYSSSNSIFEKQYYTLSQQYPGFNFIKVFNFKAQFLNAINNYEFLLFLVDDNIFTGSFSIQRIAYALRRRPRAVGFSLRHGLNLVSYPRHRVRFQKLGYGIIRHNWTQSTGRFNYPLEVSSSVYRVRDLLPLFRRATYNTPSQLEMCMNRSRFRYRNRPFLISYTQSVAFCNHVNRVQNEFNNAHGTNPRLTALSLSNAFVNGYRINVYSFIGMRVRHFHAFEMGLPLVKIY